MPSRGGESDRPTSEVQPVRGRDPDPRSARVELTGHRLPVPPTPLIGRKADLVLARELLRWTEVSRGSNARAG